MTESDREQEISLRAELDEIDRESERENKHRWCLNC
jgi:hypothetical protein